MMRSDIESAILKFDDNKNMAARFLADSFCLDFDITRAFVEKVSNDSRDNVSNKNKNKWNDLLPIKVIALY